MNRLLGDKLAIVSDKPQTTRHRLVGILTEQRGQMVFHDTPGLHRPLHRLNRAMVQQALDAMAEADVRCLISDASSSFGRGDAFALELLAKAPPPRVLALNKIDRVKKPALLPLIDRFRRGADFAALVPISARSGDGCSELLDALFDLLPVGEPLYDPEMLTIHTERFLAAERIREKLLELTREELPFTSAVQIERWEEEGRLVRLFASILVERPGQKRIVVGHQGAMIKAIGTAARRDLETFLERKVFLQLNVRVEPGWREDRRLLADLEREQGPGVSDEP
jgi:GTP-binding protein Era